MTRFALPSITAFAVLAASSALAHHAMDGETPTTSMQGLISGLAHPVLGLDHLAALIIVGLLAARFASGSLALPVFWIAGMGVGAFAHMRGIDLPGGELLVAGSVVLLGVIGFLRPTLPLPALGALFGLAGFAHGHALAESIIGAEAGVVGAYLIGLVAIQAAITVGTILMVRRLLATETPAPRLAAAALGLVGLVFLASALPGLA
jgi:urease accessory protein